MAIDPHTPTRLSDDDLDRVVGGIDRLGNKTLATIRHEPLDTEADTSSADPLDAWTAASFDASFEVMGGE